MKTTIVKQSGAALSALGLASLLVLAAACGRTGTSATSTTSDLTSALSSALASSSAASGTLLCVPAQAQIDACSGKTAGDACSLTSADGGTTTSGACRGSIDGSAVACAPNPPAPPQALLDACSGKASGDACEATEAFGNVHQGVCTTIPGGTALVCGRVHTPPQAAVDACSALAAGDSCTLPSRPDGGSASGVCSLGPAGTGPLACAPAQELLPNAEAACSGLSAGATCTIGRPHENVSGTCVTPEAGGATVCVAACPAFGGPFNCRRGGPGGPGGPGGGGPMGFGR